MGRPNKYGGYIKPDHSTVAKKSIELTSLVTRMEELQEISTRNVERYTKTPSQWNLKVVKGGAKAIQHLVEEMESKLYT